MQQATPQSLSTILEEVKPNPDAIKCECGRGYYLGTKQTMCVSCRNEVIKKKRSEEEINKQIKKLIPPKYSEAKLSHVDPEITRKHRHLRKGVGLFLHGEPGVGKTYAMAAILRDVISKGKKCLRTSYDMLCLEIRDTYKQNPKYSEDEVIKKYIEADCVFIEDVGTTTKHEETDFSRRTFLIILDQRDEQLKPTYITSNKPLIEFATSFDKRVASRMSAACVIHEMVGKDRRLEQ